MRSLLVVSLVLAVSAASSFGASVTELEARVASEPANLKAKFVLGKAYAAAGNPARAIETFNQILGRKRAPTVMFDLALEYQRTGEPEKAILLWLEIVTSENPNSVSRPLSTLTMQYLGMALHKQGNYEQALTWWRRVLEIDPANEKARRLAGISLYKMGRYKDAAREWLLLLKSRPGPDVIKKTLYYLALAFAKLEQPARAQKVAQKLLSIAPDHVGATRLLARLKAGDKQATPSTGEVTKPEDDQVRSQVATAPTSNPFYVNSATTAPVPALPARVGEGEKMSLQAEELFLDGLDQREKGNYEKALFSFLQALDVDPKFTQVYLQVGEVYLQLAKLAPTQAQFAERNTLALQSLEKVGVLAPNTLLAHSAQGKIVQAKKLEKEGFALFHIGAAQAAFKEGRHQDAFDQYILLLSNKLLSDAIFLNLSKLLPHLNRGNKQDLQFFLEDLAGKNADNIFIPYLLGMTYLTVGKIAEAKISLSSFLDRMNKLDIKDAPLEAFRTHAGAAKGDATDKYLVGCVLFAKKANPAARAALKEYVDRSKSDAPFHSDAVRKIGQIDAEGPNANIKGFEVERKELVAGVPRSEVLFGQYMERAHLDEKLIEELRSFTQGRPDNGLARFTLAAALSTRADRAPPRVATGYLKQAEELFLNLLREKWPDPDWHFHVGALALSWGAEDRGRAHLKVSGDILLLNGRPSSTRHALMALEEARKLVARGRVSAANQLLKQSQVYDQECLSYYLVKYDVDVAQGKVFGGLWNLVDWAAKAFSSPWHRLLVLTNLGVLAIQVLMLTLIGAAFALTLRHFDPLHHFFTEYFKRKGIVFSIPLLAVLALAVMPTGLVVVFPLLAWAMLSRLEKQTYLALIVILLFVPLLMPVSFEGNFDLIRMAEELRGGNLDTARPFFEQALKRNEYDYLSRYLLGQINLRERRIEPADLHFTKLYEQNPYDVGVLVNLGIVKARKGDYKKAMAFLSQAIGRQAADVPALYDMLALSAFLGQPEKAQQYLKWVTAAAKDSDQLPRYQAFSADTPQLVLMDHPIDQRHLSSLFSFFSAANFFAFNAPVIKVLLWVLLGGGLLAFLILTWQRMDFMTMRCGSCLRVICDQCQHVVANRPLCPDCVSLPEMDRDKQKALTAASAEKMRVRTLTRGWVANLALPGSGLYFAGWTPVGAFLQMVFLTLFLAWWQGGGIVLSSVHQTPDLPVLRLLLWFFLAVAMGVYGLAQMAYRQLEEEIRSGG